MDSSLFQENVPLSGYSNYRMGGTARYFCAPESVEELTEAIREAKGLGVPIFILGGGTNLLISEQGFAGAVIKPEITFMKFRKNHEDDGATLVEVGAGNMFADLVSFTAGHGLSGVEWAGGLPGTVGGAIRGNAGAFAGETKDSIMSVTSVNMATLELITRTARECHFGYRMSVFKEKDGEEVIVSAVFRLTSGDSHEIVKTAAGHGAYRTERHPIEHPNIGSTFKNVPVGEFPPEVLETLTNVIKQDPMPVVPAAYLISECGLKGKQFGGVTISEKHPNFIVNDRGGSAHDVEDAIEFIKKEVKKKFFVTLEEEVMRV
jgi:UDP-N-acetylmuramate dehydrogenase